MSNKFVFYNKTVGVIILFLYYLHITFNIKFLEVFFFKRVALAEDSWWYWPIKSSAKYIYDSSTYIYDSSTYIYDSSMYILYPSLKKEKEEKELLEGFYNWLEGEEYWEPYDPNRCYLDIPYLEINNPVPELTQDEIARAFFTRLFDEGTLIVYIFYIGYFSFTFLLFWGLYIFLKTHFRQLVSLNFFNVLKEKTQILDYVYLIVWIILQFLFLYFDNIDDFYEEWYYAITTVIFVLFIDYLTGNCTKYLATVFKHENLLKEDSFFYFFKGKHLEFFSVFFACFFAISQFLDYMGLLQVVNPDQEFYYQYYKYSQMFKSSK